MTDGEIISALKSGEELHFGVNGRNTEIVSLMARLEDEGRIETWPDTSLTQETRRFARWINR